MELHRQGLNGEFTTQIYNLEENNPMPYLNNKNKKFNKAWANHNWEAQD